jgi:hypothetical protein
MRSGLIRVSEADPVAVKRYLSGHEVEPEIAEWKYFDSDFNRDLERGIVWVREGRVAGFLGLIPFCLQRGGVRAAQCAWSCDWSVDPLEARGMGLMLAKRARDLYDGVFNVGGNENTRRIFPRLADRTVPEAAVNLVLPLRLGSTFPLLPPGILKRALSRQKLLQQIPVHWVRGPRRIGVSIETGLSPQVASALGEGASCDWQPMYDPEYVSWQLVRCPAVKCWSCWISSDSPPQTAALIWTSRSFSGYWRLFFCGAMSDLEKIEVLTGAIVSFVHDQKGIALFTMTSHLETGLMDLLAHQGFLRRRAKLPFYIMRGRNRELPLEEFKSLNFLDADLACRFDSDFLSKEQ